jgi:hypothetical protein
VNCRTGDLLAQEQVTAKGKEQVLAALGDAAAKLRGRLGESLASLQKYAAPQDSVTLHRPWRRCKRTRSAIAQLTW